MSHRGRSSLSSLSSSAYEEKDTKVLRISASDVAAIAGYHQWVDVRDLFMERLLYQDLDHVLDADADNLGLEVEDRWQRSERLLAKSGNDELHAVRKRAGNAAAVATVRDAKALKDKAKSLLKKAEAEKKLSREEARELEHELQHDINTQFGSRNEEVALRVYERRSGTEVMCSNDRILVWPFPGARHGEDIPNGALEPPPNLAKGWIKTRDRRSKRTRGSAPVALHEVAEPEASFAPAVARCLADLPVRAVLEGIIERVLSSAKDADVGTDTTITNGCSGGGGVDRSSRDEVTGPGWARVNGIAAGEWKRGGDGRGRLRVAGGAQGKKTVASRECPAWLLAPAVLWPEWRGSATSEKVEAQRGGAGARWGGYPGLWFPHSLTPPQQDAVRAIATELGLGHDLVVGDAEKRHVVVWEDSRAFATNDSANEMAAAAVVNSDIPRSGTGRFGSVGCCASVLDNKSPPRASRQSRPLEDRSSVVDLTENDRESTGRLWGSEGEGWRTPGSRTQRSCSIGFVSGTGTKSLDALDGDAEDVVDLCEVTRRVCTMEAAAVEGVGSAGSILPSQAKVETTTKGLTSINSAATSSKVGGGGSGKGHDVILVEGQIYKAGTEVVYAWGEGPAATQGTEESSSDITTTNRRPSVWCRKSQVGTLESVKIAAKLPVHQRPSLTPKSYDKREERIGEEAERNHANQGGGGGLGGGGGRSDADVGGKGGVVGSATGDMRRKACFVIVGVVDGVAEEVTAASEDSDNWETRRVVVEVKNRMNRAMDPPPLYDQIQLVTYMLMIGATVGDLVQFVKTCSRKGRGRHRHRASFAGEANLEAAAGTGSAFVEHVAVSRVELDCRRYRHKRHWQETIIPRLYAFARMVYRFRSDDLLRWRYLLSSPEEQRRMLVECCPYLDGVIVSTLPQPTPPPLASLPRTTSTPRDEASLGQTGKSVAVASPSEPPADNHSNGAESQQKREREGVLTNVGIGELESPGADAAIAAAGASPVRKKGKGEEGLAVEWVCVGQACGSK